MSALERALLAMLRQLENVHTFRDNQLVTVCAICGESKTTELGVFPTPVHKSDCKLKALLEEADGR